MLKGNKKLLSRVNGLFFRNPTIMCQLSIAPIILVGTSLLNAIALSISMAIVTIPTLTIISLIGDKLERKYETVVHLLISAIFYIPASYLIKTIFPQTLDLLGIYLPMIVINSVILIRSRAFANKNKIHWVLLDSSVYVAVFCIEICIISIIREALGKGTIMGHELNIPIKISALLMPFSGFILIGLLASIMQSLYNYRKLFSKRGNI